MSPAWNRKTGGQIAWVSGRTGLPQVYTMESDGTNVQRLTDQGYAVSPSWSPNGQFLVVSWMRKYGPGAPGAQDIYIMDIASKQWVQLTHDGGRNDFPYWSPDGQAHHFPVQPCRQPADMDHAGRWYQSEAADFCGRQQSAQLELEVISGLIFWNEVMESYLLLWQLIPGRGGVRFPSPDLSRARDRNQVRHQCAPRVRRSRVKQRKLRWMMLVFALMAIMTLGACKKKVAPPATAATPTAGRAYGFALGQPQYGR